MYLRTSEKSHMKTIVYIGRNNHRKLSLILNKMKINFYFP